MNMKQELTDLTICRAVFALWVFIYHVDLYLDFSRYLGPAADLIRHGYLGVDGFFILSGLIMARVHTEFIGNRTNYETGKTDPKFVAFTWPMLRRFWGKRLARIYPLHLVTIIILALLVGAAALCGWAPHEAGRFSLSSLLQNLLLVHGWGGLNHGTWNYPSWAISTEWAGYLVFPFVWCALCYQSQLVGMQILIASMAALGLVFMFNDQSLNMTFSSGLLRFFPEFIIGMATTRIVSAWADIALARRACLVAGCILGLLGAARGIDLAAALGLWFLLFAFLMQADTGLPALLGQRSALLWFGRRSYAFYMSFAIAELLVSQYFQHNGWAPKAHGWIFAAGMLTITMALTVSLYTWVEVPCRRLADRRLVQPEPETAKNNPGTFVEG